VGGIGDVKTRLRERFRKSVDHWPLALPARCQTDRCNSGIDRCRIWLGLGMPPAL